MSIDGIEDGIITEDGKDDGCTEGRSSGKLLGFPLGNNVGELDGRELVGM